MLVMETSAECMGVTSKLAAKPRSLGGNITMKQAQEIVALCAITALLSLAAKITAAGHTTPDGGAGSQK